MRILHVHGRYYAEGGAETYLRSLVKAQLQQGHELAVIYADETPVNGIDTCMAYFCGASHGLRSGMSLLPEFKRVVANFTPDIIHLHVVQYDISPVILRWLIKTHPTVMTMHDTLTFCLKPVKGVTRKLSARILPDGSPCTKSMGSSCLKAGCLMSSLQNEGLRSFVVTLLERFWRRHLYSSINRMIVNSQFTKSELVRNHIVKENIKVIPAPLTIPEQWSRGDSSLSSATPHLLFVGQLSTIKGAREFVAILGQLKDIPWKGSMVGEGPDRVQIEKEIKRLGLDERIELHGYVPRHELASFYRQASILVFPTLAPESLGLVGIEAMWFGLPVVAYDVGAIHEWLQDGGNGYLVSPGANKIMAERIRGLLENKSRYEEFCHQATYSAQKWLDADHSQSGFKDLYVEVTGGGNVDRY